MADFVDSNGVAWEVIETDQTFQATPSSSGDAGYINTTPAAIDVDVPGGIIVLWPQDGEPRLTGSLATIKPGVAINAFVSKAKPTFTLRVTGKVERDPDAPVRASPPDNTPPAGGASNVGSIILIVGGLWLLFGKRSPLKRARRGR